jgi:hypothetical protein
MVRAHAKMATGSQLKMTGAFVTLARVKREASSFQSFVFQKLSLTETPTTTPLSNTNTNTNITSLHTGFVGDMRRIAMSLHTREQAPKEGGTEAPPKPGPWVPTLNGYARFLAESKVVFGAFESIIAAADGHPECE